MLHAYYALCDVALVNGVFYITFGGGVKKIYDFIALLWRIPGFFFSIAFYRSTRFIILSVMGAKFKKMLKEGRSMGWVAYSETMSIPGAIPYMMCTTSRWNPHAPLGMFGPFLVKNNIDIQLESANKSAAAWIITIYRGDFEIVKVLFPGNTDESDWIHLDLPEDKYMILVRYYGFHGNTLFPGVMADGKAVVEERDVGNEYQKGNDFIKKYTLNKKGIYYFFTQYYVFQLLRWQKLLPPDVVRRIYLPVGDPQQTCYRYGVLEKNEQLNITFDESLLSRAKVYVTYCNRWGFPYHWDDVEGSDFNSMVFRQGVVYLIRVVNYSSDKDLDIGEYDFSCYASLEQDVVVDAV